MFMQGWDNSAGPPGTCLEPVWMIWDRHHHPYGSHPQGLLMAQDDCWCSSHHICITDWKQAAWKKRKAFPLLRYFFFIALLFINNGLLSTFLLIFLQEELKHLALWLVLALLYPFSAPLPHRAVAALQKTRAGWAVGRWATLLLLLHRRNCCAFSRPSWME